MRLIDADATIKEIKARNPDDVSYEDAWAITCIEHAPTIEPERTWKMVEGRKIMNDLISKLSEIRSNYNCFDENEEPYYRALSEAIQLASAQPDIIRCKDCKHRPTPTRADEGITYGFSVEFPDEKCPCQCDDGWYNWYPKDDFYCGYAGRRTDE